MFSSFWSSSQLATRQRLSPRPRSSHIGSASRGGTAAYRAFGLHAVVASLAVAVGFGCTTEKRSFGEPRETPDASPADSAATSGDGSVAASGDAAAESGSTDQLTVWLSSEGVATRSDVYSSNTPANSGPGVTDSGPTDGSPDEQSDRTNDDTASVGTPSDSLDTSADTSTTPGDDFGVGVPPDYGNLGSGEGRILVVNTLEDASVDVWLAGGDRPSAQRVATETATLVTVTRGAQRVVLTRHGSREVVGCSEWFPLRGSEQWAVVPRGGEHTCAGSGDGVTMSFRQEQSLDKNPIRYVHATTPDTFSITRNNQPEPGTLTVGSTLSGTSLPNCSSGCEVRYELVTSGVATSRYYSLTVRTVEQLPPPGEVLLLVLGNVRQDWPAEPDSLRLLRVDLDGTTYAVRRDPEVAFGRIGYGIATFNVSSPPSFTEVTSVDPNCDENMCPLEAQRWPVGTRTFLVDAPEASSSITVEFEAGHRYVLLSTPDSLNPLYFLDADFDRSKPNESYVRAVNLDDDGEPLSFGYVFGDSAVAIDTLASVPWGEVSAGNGGWVPAQDSWRLVTARDADGLGTGCFYSIDTPPGFRGYFVAAETMQPLDVTQWPPSLGATFMICF